MEDPLRILVRHQGAFRRREAVAAGYTDKMLGSLCRQQVLTRIRQGWYTFTDVWSTLSPEERHLVLARAVLGSTTGRVALSHLTALLLHGVALWGADLSRVHLTRRDDGSGRVESDVVHHVGELPDEDVVEVDGLPVTPVDRAVIESATMLSMESAVIPADSALHQGLVTDEDLYRRSRRLNHWQGSRRIHVMLGLMDGRSESVGETRARMLFRAEGIPRPELQFEVYDERGTLVAVTDFAWHEHKAFGEFDGRRKYLRPYRAGERPEEVVFREKQREDLVRGITGYGCGRMVWTDLSVPARTAAYFRRVLGLR